MTNVSINNEKSTPDDARQTLDMLNEVTEQSLDHYRGPTWLLSIGSLSFGIMTLSIVMKPFADHWDMVTSISGITLAISWLTFMNLSRKRGIKHRLLPVTTSGRLRYVLQLMALIATPLAAIFLITESSSWIAYVVGCINAGLFFWFQHNFPTID